MTKENKTKTKHKRIITMQVRRRKTKTKKLWPFHWSDRVHQNV